MYWVRADKKYLIADNMSAVLKFTTTKLNYLYLKGIPIHRLETHPLISGESNTMLLERYSDRDIQKLGYGEGKLLRST